MNYPESQSLRQLWARGFAWLASVWLAVMAGWYGWAALQTVQHPLNEGLDTRWAIGWVVLVGLVVASHLLIRRSVVTAVWLAGLATFALVMIVLSGQLLAVGLTVWLVVLAVAWGAWLMRRLGGQPRYDVAWLGMAFGLGLALLCLIALALSLAHWLSPLRIVLTLLMLSLLPIRTLLVMLRNEASRPTLLVMLRNEASRPTLLVMLRDEASRPTPGTNPLYSSVVRFFAALRMTFSAGNTAQPEEGAPAGYAIQPPGLSQGGALDNISSVSGVSSASKTPAEHGILLVLMAYTALLNLMWALAPEIMFDALNYHLSVPRLYVAHGGLVDLPYFYHSYYARLLDFLFVMPLAWGDATTPKLIVWVMGIVATAGLYALGRQVFSARVGWWAAALFYTTPLAVWLSSTVYTDLPSAMYMILSLVALLRWLDQRSAAWLWVAGLLMGAAVGVKPTGLYMLPVMGIALVGAILMGRRMTWQKRLRDAVGYGVGLMVLAAPAYLLVYTLSGDPFFSLANRGSGRLIALVTQLDWRQIDPAGLLNKWLNLPFQVTFQTSAYYEGAPNGAVGPALLLLPLLFALLWPRRGQVLALLGAGLIMLAMWGSAHNVIYARHFNTVQGPLLVLVVGAVMGLSRSVWQNRLTYGALGLILVAQGVISPVQFWNVPERYPYRVVLGQETREEFLTRALPAYSATQFLNRTATPEQSVVGVNVDTMRFYLDIPLASWWYTGEFPFVGKPIAPPQLAAELQDRGYDYVMLTQQTLYTEADNPKSANPYVAPGFLEQYVAPLYTGQNVTVYRLLSQPQQPSETPNLLVNPGFESLEADKRPSGWVGIGQVQVVQDATKVRTGQAAVEVAGPHVFFQTVPVTPGQVYRLSHMTQTGADKGQARLQVNWQTKDGRFLDATYLLVSVGPAWQRREATAVAPAQAATATIYLASQDAGHVRFDDVIFQQLIYRTQ